MCLQMTSDSVSAFQGREELACKNKKSIENAQLAKKCCLDEEEVCSGEMFSNSIKLDGLERKNVSRDFFPRGDREIIYLDFGVQARLFGIFPRKRGER